MDLIIRDFDVFQFDNLNYDIMEANNVRMSFGANGTIGFLILLSLTGGIGFIPQGFSNILFEAGIMMMSGGNPFTGELPKLSNNVRSVQIYDSDFSPEIPFSVDNPGVMADSEGKGTFSTNNFGQLKEVDIELNMLPSKKTPLIKRFILTIVLPIKAISNSRTFILEFLPIGT